MAGAGEVRRPAPRCHGGGAGGGDRPELGDGLYATIDDAVAARRTGLPRVPVRGPRPSQRDHRRGAPSHARGVRAAGTHGRPGDGIGRVEDKITKNRARDHEGTRDPKTSRSRRHRRPGLMLTEPAPFGVIGAITPVTNPSSTIINNAIGMIRPATRSCSTPTPAASAARPRRCGSQPRHRAGRRSARPRDRRGRAHHRERARPDEPPATSACCRDGRPGRRPRGAWTGKRASPPAPGTRPRSSTRRPISSAPAGTSCGGRRSTTTSCARTRRRSSWSTRSRTG